jgi:hypothetical protein
MPKLGAEVVTPQGAGRVRHIHPLKETVTVMLENHAFVEFPVTELIQSKSAAGGSCSTCGGCTVKRRASAEADNARARQAMAERRQQPTSRPPREDAGEQAAGAADSADQPSAKRKRRKRR